MERWQQAGRQKEGADERRRDRRMEERREMKGSVQRDKGGQGMRNGV